MMPSLAPTIVFVAGLVSFFSPCIVPVVPGYVAFLVRGGPATRARRVGMTAMFVLGFGIAFVAIGALIGGVASFGAVRTSEVWLDRIGGALIIVFGLAMTGLLRLPFFDRDIRYHGEVTQRGGPLVAALTLGAAFGVGWTPCVGPVLASILILAGLGGSAATGATLLAIYALGLAIPFLALAFFAEPFAAWLRRHGRATQVVEIVGGVILILLGITVFTGSAARLTSYVI